MADTKRKDDKSPALRAVGPKHPIKLPSLQRIRMPHDDLIRSAERQNAESLAQEESREIPQTSQAFKTSQVLQTRLDSGTSLVSDDLADWSKTSLDLETSLDTPAFQPESSMDLMASLPDVKGFLKLHFQLIDHLYPQLDPFERAVHETLYRLSWGFSKPTCRISYPGIARRTGMSQKSAQRAIGRLEQKGLISKSSRVIGYQKEQGIEFSVVPPPRLIAETRQVRETRQVSPASMIDTSNIQIENTQTQPSVNVGSRFTLEECRRYADHLKATGQGITNPGGYATKIFRSGEADALVENFLKPAIAINQCPDCKGMGMYYPNGIGNGPVIKCRHEKLKD